MHLFSRELWYPDLDETKWNFIMHTYRNDFNTSGYCGTWSHNIFVTCSFFVRSVISMFSKSWAFYIFYSFSATAQLIIGTLCMHELVPAMSVGWYRCMLFHPFNTPSVYFSIPDGFKQTASNILREDFRIHKCLCLNASPLRLPQ